MSFPSIGRAQKEIVRLAESQSLWLRDWRRNPSGIRKECIFSSVWPSLVWGWAHRAGKKSLQLRSRCMVLNATFYLTEFYYEKKEGRGKF